MKRFILFSAIIIAFIVLTSQPAAVAQGGPLCGDDVICISKGWKETERSDWYRLSQGSRLIPEAWANALRTADGTRFFDARHFDRFGYVREYSGDRWPIGFVRDRDERSGNYWIGLNCSACHTVQINFNGKKMRVDGAATLADFQTMVEALIAAMRNTVDNADTWKTFVADVLGESEETSQADQLKVNVGHWLAFREGLRDRNKASTPDAMRYGYGRLDAVGHILNKVAHSLAPGQDKDWPSDAPVSYPFIWNAAQHDRLQWNGMAEKKLQIGSGSRLTDLGGLARNVGQVIGVFGHIEVVPLGAPFDTRISETSIRVRNLVRLERILARLESPRWPEKIDTESQDYKDGAKLYKDHCEACHELLDPDDLTSRIVAKMQPIFAPEAGTDPWMACNTILHSSKSGPLEGGEVGYFPSGEDKIRAAEPTSKLLRSLVIRTIIRQRGDLVRVFGDDLIAWFGSLFDSTPGDKSIQTAALQTPMDRVRAKKARLLATCKGLLVAADEKVRKQAAQLLRYKGRPLNGIWATAPYLHNGSVPTLRDLLLPPDVPAPNGRPSSFYVGSTTIDTKNVGFATTKTDNSFEFRTKDDAGKPIPGNSNAGHRYGLDLNETDRDKLLLYLKSL